MLKLVRFLKPYKILISAVLVFVVFQTLTELTLPTLMADIVEKGILEFEIPYIWRTGGIMLAVALAGGISTVFLSFFSAKISAGVGKNIREELFGNVMGFSLNDVDKFGTASLITRTTNDVLQIQNVLVFILRMILTAPIMGIGGLFMAVRMDRGLSVVFLLALPVITIFIFVLFKKGLPLFKSMQKKLDKINLILRERLTGIRVIRAYDKEPFERKRFDTANKDLTDTAIKVNRIMASAMPMIMIILNFTTLAIVWFSSQRIDAGLSNIGTMMAFIQYAMLILFSLVMFASIFIILPRAIASGERINEVLETDPSEKFASNKKPTVDQSKGIVEFRGVTFSYPGAFEPVLHNLSFFANPGETTAIIGSTGSGKSSVVKLIPRFYEIQEGQILIDNVDIKDYSLSDLRKKIGYVPQKAVLFSGTIKENLKYGKEDATEPELRESTETARAYDFIMEKENGFEEVLSQDATNLSGGQKQRLSIARAIIRKPEIYIFDDSFSALDFKTDAQLRNELKKTLVDKTVIIVTQRVSTIMDADKIIVLDEGRMAGTGTHSRLLETCRVYKEIVDSQLSREEKDEE